MKLLNYYKLSSILKIMKIMGKKSKIYFLCIAISCFVNTLWIVFETYGIKGVVNSIEYSNRQLFFQSVLLYLLSRITFWVWAPISAYVSNVCSKGTMRDMKANLSEHVMRLPQSYHDNKATGELISLFSNDADCIQNIYDWSFPQALNSAIYGVVGIAMMVLLDIKFAVVVFSLVMINIFVTTYFGRKLEEVGQKLQEKLAENNVDTYDLVKAAKTIQLLHITEDRQKRFHETTDTEANIRMKSGKISSKMNAIAFLINSLSYFAVFAIGAVFVYYKVTDWGTVTAIAGLKGATDCLFSECGMHIADIKKNIPGAKRVIEVYEIKEELESDYFGYRAIIADNPISMENVTFNYSNEIEVLNNFNMKLGKNKFTVLLGESGCGKSTIMKIMMALYPIDKGEILYASNKIFSIENLRNEISYVPQEPMLIADTVYENILCSNPMAAYEDVIFAAKLAGADGFISKLENGYETMLLDCGKSLSGGQRQRIAIARALVKRSSILLFDEITSALDQENEEQILRIIKEISKEKTVFMITHAHKKVMEYADCMLRLQN